MARSTLLRLLPVLAPLALLAAAGCSKEADVTLYVALDQEHSERLVKQFEEESGLAVNARFDTEASKTVGLVSAILEEASRPRCDVFWNNELAQTVRLAQKGLLEAYDSPAAAGIPKQFRDPAHLWTGFAARARVFIVNTKLLPDPASWPRSTFDLIDPKWKGNCAIARPLTGTTLTHFAALKHVIGEAELTRLIDGLFANDVKLLQSNGATMRAVSDGDVAFAYTDTDDFHVALEKGFPVACVFPDQGEGEVGTMLIPNSVAIVKNAPHPEAARKLVDFIVSEKVEALLAAAKSAQIPVRSGVTPPPAKAILPIGEFKAMVWDPAKTAIDLEAAAKDFATRFGG
jgi:iron(III) transport system substrate-binding protein